MQPAPMFNRSLSTTSEKVKPANFLETLSSAKTYEPRTPKEYNFFSDGTYILEPALEQRPLEERLFVALAEAKVWTSRIAMHLDRETRDRLFRQLDVLHDAEEWGEGDRPVALDSYKSLVRAILFHRINRRPSLSLMPNGNLLALWTDGADYLTIEFLSRDQAKWLVQSTSLDGPERAAGTSPLQRLRAVLQTFCTERWCEGS